MKYEYRTPIATGDHQLPLDIVRLHQRSPFKVPNGLLTDLHLDEVRTEPINDIQVGGEISVGIKMVLISLLLIAFGVKDHTHCSRSRKKGLLDMMDCSIV